MEERVYHRRNNFYYVTLLAYVVFAVIYILVTGTITSETVEFGFRDPVVYIIGLFILHAVVMLIVNLVRNARLVLLQDRIVFRTRFRERIVLHSQIASIMLKRERRRFNDGTFAVVKIFIRHRPRPLRIRVANYEQEQDLYQQFKRLKTELNK